MSPIQTTALLTIAQTAERLQLRPHTIYNLVSKGVIPAVRIGKSVRVSPVDLEEFIRVNRTTARINVLA